MIDMDVNETAIPTVTLQGQNSRFVFIDALRGIAAVAVLCHHLYNNSELQGPLSRALPHIVTGTFNFGAHGVQIFFVISGFVISCSLRRTRVTPRSALSFAIRRQVRLDPAYWVMLAFGTLSMWFAAHAHQYQRQYPRPSAGDFLASLFYLQNILHRRGIVGVAWTLCLEIQFYLVFIGLLAIGQRVGKRQNMVGAAPIVVAGTAVLSAFAQGWAVHTGRLGLLDMSWFVYTWYMFALGILAYWCSERYAPAWLFIVPSAVALVGGCWLGFDRMIVAASTSLIIYGLGAGGQLRSWSLGPVVQYFGAISYSLYLVHLEVLARIYKTAIHWTGLSAGPAVCWFVVAGVTSVIVAHLFHHWVEEPTRKLASRLKPPGEAAAPSAKFQVPAFSVA